MKKIYTYIHQLENFTLFALFLSLLGLAFSQVVLRNFFGTSIVWADVAIRILVLWVAVFGAMVATRNAEHIKIDLLQSVTSSKKMQKWACILYNFVAAIIAGIVAFYSLEMVRLEYAYLTYAFAKVPTWFAQSILPFGFTVMGGRFLLRTAIEGATLYKIRKQK